MRTTPGRSTGDSGGELPYALRKFEMKEMKRALDAALKRRGLDVTRDFNGYKKT
jgi:hypothetical protein